MWYQLLDVSSFKIILKLWDHDIYYTETWKWYFFLLLEMRFLKSNFRLKERAKEIWVKFENYFFNFDWLCISVSATRIRCFEGHLPYKSSHENENFYWIYFSLWYTNQMNSQSNKNERIIRCNLVAEWFNWFKWLYSDRYHILIVVHMNNNSCMVINHTVHAIAMYW